VAGGKNPPNLQPQMSLTVVGEKGLTGREKALIRYITQKTAQTIKNLKVYVQMTAKNLPVVTVRIL